MKELPTQEIMGIPFLSSTYQQSVEHFIHEIQAGKRLRVITANPEIVMLQRKNPEVAQIIQEADYITPDGVGILIAGKILQRPIRERITGVELTTALLKYANECGWRVYLLGATPDVMKLVDERIREQYPRIQLRTHHGYFTESEEADIIAEVNEHCPHILLVGLGAPRQELWLSRHNLNYNLAMGVGGTFDVLSGKVKRAPLLWQKLGVEWLYRLLHEPRRAKRMLALPQFLIEVFAERMRRSRKQ